MATQRVGVLGSGIMGAGLAEVAARAGYQVIVRSRSQASADAMIATIDKGLIRAIERGRTTEDERAEILGRITATDQLSGLADCDLIIESVVEDLEVKRALFAQLDSIVKPDAILATNTSTLPVIELAMATSRPGQVCGVHFFNPATSMTLVEIIRPLTASEHTIATATEFATACGKDAVEVCDRAGFIVNALLFPYLNNAVRMYEQGTASIEAIDTAMKGGCNFPMGPFALLDLVGLDTAVAILDALYAEFRDPNYAAVPTLRRMVSAGHLGRKTKRGFLTY
jgi:3-hydroxybutyryl-CoA dehydrogenase